MSEEKEQTVSDPFEPVVRRFSIGDTIRNVKPYVGESALYIHGMDEYGYLCYRLKGKHCKDHDFANSEHIFLHSCDTHYEEILKTA
tara:strand:+ start:255 stop:512 length:258 start_codon:yes stop_codon:yes gene_type:complete